MKKVVSFLLLGMIAAPLAAQTPAQPSMSEMFMKQMDENKDGKVSKEEFLKPNEAQFKHMDKNGDGGIDKAEVDAFAEEMRQRMMQMQQQQGGQPPQPAK